MKANELIKKLGKRRNGIVYYQDKFGIHEITDVEPILIGTNTTATIIMNGDGGRYDKRVVEQKWILERDNGFATNVKCPSCGAKYTFSRRLQYNERTRWKCCPICLTTINEFAKMKGAEDGSC